MSDLNIYQRMHAIMNDVSYVQKENKKVNNQYTFVSGDAVTAKVRPAMIEHGVLAIPSFFDISVDGNRTNCSMSMTFVNIDKPDDRIVIPCAGFGQGIDPQDKGAGKAMTYAFKYALLKIFELETGDDVEKDNVDHKPAPKPAKAPKAEAAKDETPEGVTERLIQAIKKQPTVAKLKEWENLQIVKDARDKLFMDDNILCRKVDDAFNNRHTELTEFKA